MVDLADSFQTFLTPYSGILTDISTTKRYNHQHAHPPGDGYLTCVTARVRFDNAGIFGSTGPFLTEVFPRYRCFLKRMTDFLSDRNIGTGEADSQVAINVVPLASDRANLGEPLPKFEGPSRRGVMIVPMETLAAQSEYYKALSIRYPIQHGLLTDKGTVVGPDAGIISTAYGAASISPRRMRVIEIGTGAGTTPLVLAGLDKLESYHGNDFSPEMVDFFEHVTQPRLSAANIASDIVAGACLEFEFTHQADFIIVGVFYQAQPDLFALKGRAISDSLAADGIVAVQSGKIENTFITELLLDSEGDHVRWPWYDPAFCIGSHLRHVVKVNVYDETMLLCGNQLGRVEQLAALLAESTSNSAQRLSEDQPIFRS